ncbi:hypothetical protein MUK42_15194 [Musa troglodytarum]|uniref:Uncharacterized protein n=1 Tax=Musa troglodytarum TaxID=320322 RepID=A0A9E7I6Z2_9LILI|nr:hypothetical protein MUK42_15194 [Musa troglodytarum]
MGRVVAASIWPSVGHIRIQKVVLRTRLSMMTGAIGPFCCYGQKQRKKEDDMYGSFLCMPHLHIPSQKSPADVPLLDTFLVGGPSNSMELASSLRRFNTQVKFSTASKQTVHAAHTLPKTASVKRTELEAKLS